MEIPKHQNQHPVVNQYPEAELDFGPTSARAANNTSWFDEPFQGNTPPNEIYEICQNKIYKRKLEIYITQPL